MWPARLPLPTRQVLIRVLPATRALQRQLRVRLGSHGTGATGLPPVLQRAQRTPVPAAEQNPVLWRTRAVRPAPLQDTRVPVCEAALDPSRQSLVWTRVFMSLACAPRVAL